MVSSTPTLEPTHALDLAMLPTERLEAELCHWAAALAAADCHFLALIAEFDRRKGWQAWGMRSCADWLSWRCALSPAAARERVRVALAVQDLPRTLELFRAGRLSYSKVRAITRVATPDTENDLLSLAEHATASQLEYIVQGWRKCRDAHDPDRHRRHLEKRYVKTRYDDDGSLVGSFRIPPESASLLEKALDAHLPPVVTQAAPGVGVVPDTIAQRRADALVAVADAGMGSSGRKPHERTMVVVEVEHQVLCADADGTCRTDRGVALGAETARRLACDCTEMTVMVDGDGDEIGRSKPTSSIPRSVRRALDRRDRGRCRFVGCCADGKVEAHHLIHRAHGGDHELANLVTLCAFHHHLVHEGGWRLEVSPNGDGFVATSPDGRRIGETAEPGRPVSADTVTRSLDALHIGVGPETLWRGTGERMDRDAVDWVIWSRVHLARNRHNEGRRGVSAETERHGHRPRDVSAETAATRPVTRPPRFT